jgi:hypothetical protein
MSYLAQAALATYDQTFKMRLSMCVVEQAKIYTDDERLEYSILADQTLANYLAVTERFVPLVATQPGMTPDATDADILAAVQFLWPVLGAPLVPVVIEPSPPPLGASADSVFAQGQTETNEE